jgi:glycosyltransferase involved in cell wall biosynthesis
VTAVGGGINPLPHVPVSVEHDWQQILFVGLDFERKGGEILVEAFIRVATDFPNAKLVIVGTSRPPEIAESAQVQYRGRVWDRAELAQIYAQSGVFCLPALFEPFGLVTVEAMRSGLACIVSDRNELPYLVEDGVTGLVVESGSVDSLEAALRNVLADVPRTRELADAGRAKSQGMTWESVVDRMVTAIPR